MRITTHRPRLSNRAFLNVNRSQNNPTYAIDQNVT